MISLLRTASILLTAGYMLAGCTAPRTVQDDPDVRSVGVVSLLNESAPIRHLGLTVFNNHQATVDQGGKLKQVVIETVKERLKTSRPQWAIKVDETDMTAPGEKNHASIAGKDFTDNVGELVAIARRLDVDQLFVLVDSTGQNFPGQGVGISFRAIGNDPDPIMAHSFIALVVMDRNGKELVSRGAINENPKQIRNSSLGLRSDMSTLNDPKVREKVSLTLQNRLKAAVNEAMTRAGY